jgi:hypothetical protein
MPSLGRFLYGAWPNARIERNKSENAVESVVRVAGANSHARRLHELGTGRWRVTDRLGGPFDRVVLRWHLPDWPWEFTAPHELTSPTASIVISGIDRDTELEVATRRTVVSRYYLELEPCVALEISARRNGRKTVGIETTITLHDGCERS